MTDKIFYNESSAQSLGWDPSWLGAKRFDEALIRKIRAFQREVGLQLFADFSLIVKLKKSL